MRSLEIERCEGCNEACNPFFLQTATELLFSKKKNDEFVGDKKNILHMRLREIAKCALTAEQVSNNIDNLTDIERIN